MNRSDQPVSAHRGWPILTLASYSTPYYYAGARRIAGRLVLGPASHRRTVAAVKRQIDRELAKGGVQ